MVDIQNIQFADSAGVKKQPDQFVEITIDTRGIVKSWKKSVFSFEWLDSTGQIKAYEYLSQSDQAKRDVIEGQVESGKYIEKPILGLGAGNHVEIGSGRAALLTLTDLGLMTMPVHIPKSNETYFKEFIAAL